MKFGNDFVTITLIHQKALTFARKIHLDGILWNQRVKESIVFFGNGAFFRTKNSAQSLGFLTPRPAVWWNLDQDVCVRQVEGRVSYFTDEDGVHFRVQFEILKDLKSLILRGRPVNVRFVHFDRVMLQCEDVVRKYNNLVVAPFVIANEELASSEFVRIHYE